MATSVSLSQILTTPFLVGARDRLYLLYWQSYSQFCVKIHIFSLPWRQGSFWAKCQWHRWIAWPRKPPSWCKILGCILYKLSCSQFCAQKQSFGCHSNKGQCGTNFHGTIRLPDPENPLVSANILALSLTVSELLPFEVTIGRNANSRMLGENGVYIFFCNQNHIRNVVPTGTRHLSR